MKKRLSHFILIVALFVSYNTIAQFNPFKKTEWESATFYFSSGDEITGQTKKIYHFEDEDTFFIRPKSFVIRKDKDSKKHKFYRKNLDSVVYHRKSPIVFKTIKIKRNKYNFAQEIIKGNVSLYVIEILMHNQSHSYTIRRIYLKRKDEEVASRDLLINTFTYFHKEAAEYFKACPEVSALILAGGLEEEDIIRIVRRYNECVE